MMDLSVRSVVLLLASVLGVSSAFGQSIYLEQDGILALEAEAADFVPGAHWVIDDTVGGASEGSYLRATTNSFGTPGVGIISYQFRTTTTSDFQFNFRSYIGAGTSSTDHNDAWVRLVDSDGNGIAPIPNGNSIASGQWHKAYQNHRDVWTYQASNVDNVGRSISWSLVAGNDYALELSSRSAGHLIDRLFLWDRAQYDLADEARGFPNTQSQSGFGALENSVLVPEPASAATLALLSAAVLGRTCGRRRSR